MNAPIHTPGTASRLLDRMAAYIASHHDGEQETIDLLNDCAHSLRVTPPAPVTEGAQREAVAWRTMSSAPKDGTVILLARDDGSVTCGNWMEEQEAVSSEYTTHGEYLGSFPNGDVTEACWISWDGGFTEEHPPLAWRQMPAPPPPDRVQPERVEEAKPGDDDFVAPPPSEWSKAGQRRLMEALEAAPPTDASGGVTEVTDEMVRGALDTFPAFQSEGVPTPAEMRCAIKGALEAADRARKPGEP